MKLTSKIYIALLICLSFLIGLTQISCINETTTDNTLSVYFLDVGQGDTILLDQGTTEVLIDGGGVSSGVLSFLGPYINGNLEVMVATHAHADHIGGLTEILEYYQVGRIWHSGDTSTSETYKSFMNAVNNEGAIIHTGTRGDTIVAGELSFLVMHPDSQESSSNNNSLVLWLKYGNIDFLFTGDAEEEAEAEILAASGILLPEVEVLKVGHHASRTASSPAFLDIIMPEVAIYMAGTSNPYGHPHQETLTNLKNIGSLIYGTDVNGTIRVITDGQKYTVQTETTGTPQAPEP